jgi:hypothetical protein
MTLLATNAKRKGRGAVLVLRRRQGLKVGRVTFQATGNNRSVEVGKAISIPWAIDPAQPGPIGDRQLKELVLDPVQIRLALLARSDHNSNALRARMCVRRLSRHRSLKKAIFAIHLLFVIWKNRLGFAVFRIFSPAVNLPRMEFRLGVVDVR